MLLVNMFIPFSLDIGPHHLYVLAPHAFVVVINAFAGREGLLSPFAVE